MNAVYTNWSRWIWLGKAVEWEPHLSKTANINKNVAE